MKNVQIPYNLFFALLQYHLMMDDDYADEIRYGLEQKLEAMFRHELYAKYKTALTPIEEAYHQLFDAALTEFNAKQKRKDRCIDNYYEKSVMENRKKLSMK